jgi:multidrug efflux pump subunit AcrA (membrane-fusion protein)
MINQFDRNKVSFLPVVSVMLFSLHASSVYAAQLPQVKTEQVTAWHQGLVEQLNCKVTSPYLSQFASDTHAKLNFVLPAGSRVKQDTLVAEQDRYYIQKAIEQLQLERSHAQLSAQYNDQEYHRLLALGKELVSPSSINDLALKRDQANNLQRRLKKEIERQQYQGDKLRYFAPADGEVVNLHAAPGQFVNQGETILTFLADSNKEITCELSLQAYWESDGISKSRFQLASGEALINKRISQIVAPDSQVLNIYLSLPEQASTPLFLQQRLKVMMHTGDPDLSRLPLDSLNLHNDGNFVWQLLADTTVNKQLVEVVDSQHQYLLVRSSLKAGDQVITLGKNNLAQDQKVAVSQNKTRSTD